MRWPLTGWLLVRWSCERLHAALSSIEPRYLREIGSAILESFIKPESIPLHHVPSLIIKRFSNSPMMNEQTELGQCQSKREEIKTVHVNLVAASDPVRQPTNLLAVGHCFSLESKTEPKEKPQ